MARTERYVLQPETEPTWLQRMIGAVRSYTIGPLTLKSPEIAKYLGGGSTLSGVSVNEESSLTTSAMWCGVNMIADDIASLPLHLYKRLKTGGKDRFEEHPLYRLLHDEPNPEMTTMVWRRTMQIHALLWQNAYSEIERDHVGRPIAVWPLVPERVQKFRDRSGALKYRVRNDSGSESIIDDGDMLHLIGFSLDGMSGSSLVQKARESIGLALATEKFGASFFGNGSTFGGVISYKGPKPTEPAQANLREVLEQRHQGVERAYKLLALFNDPTFTQVGVAPNEGQFTETRVFQIREVARWLRIPPHKLADLADATYSNVEQMDAAYLSSCIRPWLVLWQQELARKLVARLERMQQFIEHDTHGFLSVDAASRAALYPAEFNVGALMPNEIRGYENRDPIEGGDQTFVQMNMMPLGRMNDWVDAQIESLKAKAKPTTVPVPPTEEQVASFTSALERKMDDQTAALMLQAEAQKIAADATRAEFERMVADVRGGVAASDAAKAYAERSLVEAQEQCRHADEQLRLAQQRIADETQQRAAVEQRATEAQTQVDGLTADVNAARALVARKESDLLALEARRQQELTAQIGQTAEQIADLERQWTAERTRLEQERADAQTAKNDTDVMLGAAERERDAATRAVEAAHVQIATLQSAYDGVTVAFEHVRGKVDTAEAVAEALRQQLAEQRTLAERAALAHTQAEAARVLAEATRADRDATLTLERAERAVVTHAQAESQNRLQAIVAAHRALIVDAVGRLLQRESDRARKAQATPEKLRAWIETFYQTHGDVCRAVFRPAVIAWAASAGVSAESALTALVQEHIDTSRRELIVAADTEDGDELAANLARVLRRWETERADTVADRLMAEGDRYGH